jgi:hypothetical protein
MSARPPSDAIVALRSFPRRFGALFLGLGEDESPDALAVRPAPDGATALGHVAAATDALAAAARGLSQILVTDDPVVEAIGDGSPTPSAPTGSVDERLSELSREAGALAERAERVTAESWGRTGRTPDGETVRALDVLWLAVDAAVERLRAAERTLREARQSR